MIGRFIRGKWMRVALVTLPVLAACGQAPPAPEVAAVDDALWSPPPLVGEVGRLPDARDVVRRAIEFMSSHERLAFELVATYEVVQENGQKVEFDMLQRVALERPRRMYWATLNDDASTETAWCGDGQFTLVRQPTNTWGRVNVPLSLPAALSRIAHEYDVAVPFVDILSGDASELWIGDDVEWVDYIGEAWIQGHWTDHVALRRPGADIQLWFRADDEPFPVRMEIIRTNDDGQPAFSARFREWRTLVPDGTIPAFEPPQGSEQLEIVPSTGR